MALKAIGAVFLLLLFVLWFTIRAGLKVLQQQLGAVIGYIKIFVLYSLGGAAGVKVKGFSILVRIVKKGIVHVTAWLTFGAIGGLTYSVAVHGVVGGYLYHRLGRDFTLGFLVLTTTHQYKDKKG